MFCNNCGAQHADDATFCPNCGASLQTATTEESTTQPPVYQAPVYQAPAQPVTIASASAQQKKMAVVIAIIAIFALIVGFAHTFCMVELPVSVSAEVDTAEMGMTGDMALDIDGTITVFSATPGLLSEALDVADRATNGYIDESFAMGYVGLILFGIVNLVIAAIGVLFYLRARFNNPLYDQTIGRICKCKTPAALIGLAGVAAALLEILFLCFVGVEEEAGVASASISVGVHWLTWVSLFIYGALAASQLLAIDKTEE